MLTISLKRIDDVWDFSIVLNDDESTLSVSGREGRLGLEIFYSFTIITTECESITGLGNISIYISKLRQ